MDQPGATLARALTDGRLVELVDEASPLRPALDAIGRRHSRPLQIQIAGRPGTGRDTMARAVRERLAVTAIGPGEAAEGARDADLWLYVLTGPPRRADRKALSALPAELTMVVLGKADTFGDWETATEVAHQCAAVLELPVAPVSQLLACADMRDDEYNFLRMLHHAGEEMPSMAGQFLVGSIAHLPVPDDVAPLETSERLMRANLMSRVDQFGIQAALDLIASGHPASADAAALNTALRNASGIDVLRDAIGDRVGQVRVRRDVQARAALEDLAAAGEDRDVLEQALQLDGDVAEGDRS